MMLLKDTCLSMRYDVSLEHGTDPALQSMIGDWNPKNHAGWKGSLGRVQPGGPFFIKIRLVARRGQPAYGMLMLHNKFFKLRISDHPEWFVNQP
jgi:hypothetical protein